MRKLLLILCVILPQGIKQGIYRGVFRWKIGKRVRIGFSYLDSVSVDLGNDVRIGHFNVARGLSRFHIGERSYLANFNEFFGNGGAYEGFQSVLEIGSGVNFMSHHFIDVAGIVSIGDRATIGGRDTHFWSHTRTLKNGIPKLEPTKVMIGADVYVGARATLVGCSIPEGAVVGAGSVVTKCFAAEAQRLLIAGNPAAVKKRYDVTSENAVSETPGRL